MRKAKRSGRRVGTGMPSAIHLVRQAKQRPCHMIMGDLSYTLRRTTMILKSMKLTVCMVPTAFSLSNGCNSANFGVVAHKMSSSGISFSTKQSSVLVHMTRLAEAYF